jgi:uncharacterized protein
MAYQAVNATLRAYDADFGAAEAHGMAVGMLCVEMKADAANWLHELFAEDQDLLDTDKSLLLNLFERTRELLEPETEEFVFDLFLPDDDEPLQAQVEALRNWCQGFLFGVGYAQADADWPGDTGEVMRDLIEITKLDNEVAGEDDENAFAEIHEYVRTAVFMIRDEFAEKSTNQLH